MLWELKERAQMFVEFDVFGRKEVGLGYTYGGLRMIGNLGNGCVKEYFTYEFT